MTMEIEKLKEIVQTSHEPIPKLYKNTCKNIKNTGLDLVRQIPTLNSIQHSLYDIRNKSLQVKKTHFEKFDEVCVPSKFLDFMLSDYYHEEKRILIFCSKEARGNISSINEYFGDATFSSCPKPFYQLFIIHGEVDSSVTLTATVPLIYVLMPDKKEDTYRTVLQLIKSQLPAFQPKKYHCDFEVAELNSFRKEFPSVSLRGCYFHWSKAVWKKAKSLGIKSKFDKRIIGLTAALPLLPAENITDGLEYTKGESRENKKFKLFFRYIDKFWMTEKFNEVLCVFGERHRTNNVAESFHAKLNKEINKKNKSVLTLLAKLKEIESTVIHQNTNRRNTNIDTDDYILNIQLQLLNKEISVGHMLDKLR